MSLFAVRLQSKSSKLLTNLYTTTLRWHWLLHVVLSIVNFQGCRFLNDMEMVPELVSHLYFVGFGESTLMWHCFCYPMWCLRNQIKTVSKRYIRWCETVVAVDNEVISINRSTGWFSFLMFQCCKTMLRFVTFWWQIKCFNRWAT